MSLTLRWPREEEEEEFVRAHRATSPEVPTFLHHYEEGMSLRRYLEVLADRHAVLLGVEVRLRSLRLGWRYVGYGHRRRLYEVSSRAATTHVQRHAEVLRSIWPCCRSGQILREYVQDDASGDCVGGWGRNNLGLRAMNRRIELARKE